MRSCSNHHGSGRAGKSRTGARWPHLRPAWDRPLTKSPDSRTSTRTSGAPRTGRARVSLSSACSRSSERPDASSRCLPSRSTHRPSGAINETQRPSGWVTRPSSSARRPQHLTDQLEPANGPLKGRVGVRRYTPPGGHSISSSDRRRNHLARSRSPRRGDRAPAGDAIQYPFSSARHRPGWPTAVTNVQEPRLGNPSRSVA